MISDFSESGLCEKSFVWGKSVIRLLQTGEDFPSKCLSLAMEKAKGEYPDKTYENLSEEHWNAAAKELGME